MKKFLLLVISLFVSIFYMNAEEISYKEKTTSTSGMKNALGSIYNSLVTPDIYLYKTTKFSCSSKGCETSKFNNIGNISLYEYTRIGGKNSYLVDIEEFYAINDNEDVIITPVEERSATSSDTAGLRPNLFVKKGVRVTGSGKKTDPWIFVEPNYYISIKLENANIEGKSIVTENIKEIDGVRSYSIQPNVKHALKNIDCGSYTDYVMDKNELTLNNINSDISCTITYELVDKTFDFLADEQEYEILYTGYYTIEAWGAQGADEGGLGAYASGEIYLKKGTILKINTGGSGDYDLAPGYNGGGSGLHYGGGASTVKIDNTIIIAAAGGGGGKDGTPGGTDTGQGGTASSTEGSGTNGGAGTAGTNAGGGGSGYKYSYDGNCSSCYTGENTCVGGYVSYNCSTCYYGSNTCVGGYESYTYNHASGSITHTCMSWGWNGVGTNNVVCNSGDTKSVSCPGQPSGACSLGDTIVTSCTGYCVGTRYNSCKTGSNTCSYGCDSYYDSCKTGSNTCEYGCDTLYTPYNSGYGGTNIFGTNVINSITEVGTNSSNGKITISYKNV